MSELSVYRQISRENAGARLSIDAPGNPSRGSPYPVSPLSSGLEAIAHMGASVCTQRTTHIMIAHWCEPTELRQLQPCETLWAIDVLDHLPDLRRIIPLLERCRIVC